MRVLVTGGSGYIGSHTCVQLLQNGHDVIILDNLCNSKRSVLPVIERLGGKQPTFVEGDIRNEALMTEILHDHAIEAVIHFAGLKAVGESVAKPLEYYDNNVNGTLRLISAMRAANVKNFIFSSSATVFGRVVIAKNRQRVAATHGNLGDIRHQVVRDALRIFTHIA